jgi:membrane associated rhomboid family serine protease
MPAASGRLAGFGFIGVTLSAFVLLNIIIFVTVSVNSGLRDVLVLSPERPYSIVTAVFTHRDFAHLIGNLTFFAFLSVFFMGVNASAGVELRRRLSMVFCLGSFIAGIAAVAVQFYVWRSAAAFDITACGSSGVIYAGTGILLASALCGLPGRLARLRFIECDQFGVGSSGIFYAVPFSVCAATLFTCMSIFETNSFFYVSQETAWLCHELGFLLGLFTSALFFIFYYSKKCRYR